MPARKRSGNEQRNRIFKSFWLIGLVAFFFIILILRLFYLQVIQADLHIRLSKENQMRLRILKAPRGNIYDRNGEVLARNRPSYSIFVLPSAMQNQQEVIGNLLKIRDENDSTVFDSSTLVSLINKARYRRFDLTRLKEDVSTSVMSIVEEHSMQLQGIVVEIEARREYPQAGATFHTMGYISEIPEEKFDSLKEEGYLYGDLIGKAGLEEYYETTLRGVDGREYIEVNAFGKSLGVIKHMPRSNPQPGNDIFTTIDARLQRTAQEHFPDTIKGAVVAIDPRNGEVLVMYSSPTVDPNIFSLSTDLRAKRWTKVALDSRRPLNNRATMGVYPPGSTFKLVTSIAGMEASDITEKSHMSVPCRGAYRFGNMIKRCWYGKGHGNLTLQQAVQKSCNVYFYQLGLLIGDQGIVDYAKMFGLGQKTGIDLPNERTGYLSGEAAHNKRFKKKIETSEGWNWTRGLILDMAIGQSQVFTPLQLTLMVGGMGNGHAVYTPFIRKETRSFDGAVLDIHAPQILHTFSLDTATISTIHTAMHSVILPGGTGGRARVKDIPVGGKTGSAENPHGEKTHGLFVGCAPFDNPVIAIAVVVENAGHGGSVAAPIAGAVLNKYFYETEEGLALVDKYTSKK